LLFIFSSLLSPFFFLLCLFCSGVYNIVIFCVSVIKSFYSGQSSRRRGPEETPRGTPGYKYNSWADEQGGDEEDENGKNHVYEDDDTFEREFYDADENGARDESFNPFQGDDDKFKKMEEELTKRQIQKLTARQRLANEGKFEVFFLR
jgi:hypothetical protein